jgi:hypothetical protein
MSMLGWRDKWSEAARLRIDREAKAMTKKEKGHNRSGAAQTKFTTINYTRSDAPLTGWINLGKQNCIKRRQKCNWQRGR